MSYCFAAYARLINFDIRVGNNFDGSNFNREDHSLCLHSDAQLDQGVWIEFNCSQIITGRYLSISYARNDLMEFHEVQVFPLEGTL